MKKIGFKVYETIGISHINPRALKSIHLGIIFEMDLNSIIVKEIKNHDYNYYLEFIKLYHDDAWQITVSSSPLLKIKSIDDFWNNWNSFKKLKGFL